MNVTIIGGGIIGLSSAYYLKKSGWDVTVIDKGDFTDNCSWGNAGYICPSHFVPLAAPGIVKKGLKWMWNSSSPFYIQPRLNSNLIDWGWKFVRSANSQNVRRSAIPLRDIALLSQYEYKSWANEFDFSYEHKGLLEIFQTDKGEEHAHHMVEKSKQLGLETDYLSYAELSALEPHTRIIAKGAIIFRCDGHVYPDKLMRGLINKLKEMGVTMVPHEKVTGVEKRNGKISAIITEHNSYTTDKVVLSAGSWSREIASLMGVPIPLVAGRGYSITLEDSPFRLNHPAILLERRVAITPMDGNKIRFGGTMEVTSIGRPPRMNRVKGIINAVKTYIPDFNIPMPEQDKIWYGYRPCSADGLPYIGRTKKWENLVVATGHSMLGLSLGAGTGKLVGELLNEQTTSMNIDPFNVERFS